MSIKDIHSEDMADLNRRCDQAEARAVALQASWIALKVAFDNVNHERITAEGKVRELEAERDRLKDVVETTQAGLQRWVEGATREMAENIRLKALVADSGGAHALAALSCLRLLYSCGFDIGPDGPTDEASAAFDAWTKVEDGLVGDFVRKVAAEEPSEEPAAAEQGAAPTGMTGTKEPRVGCDCWSHYCFAHPAGRCGATPAVDYMAKGWDDSIILCKACQPRDEPNVLENDGSAGR